MEGLMQQEYICDNSEALVLKKKIRAKTFIFCIRKKIYNTFDHG